MITAVLVSLALSSAAVEPSPAQWQRPGANLAAGRPYTLAPKPNYALCSADPDGKLLTDGVYTEGYFWTQPTTVGWQGGASPRIVVDLGAVRPIAGASYHCAAGRAGVEWPTAILLLVSDDGAHWYRAGDLVAQGREPEPPAEYTTHRYWTDQLAGHGRYVAFVVAAPGSYVFCDEVEVYAGPDALLGQPPHGQAAASLDAAVNRYFYASRLMALVARHIREEVSAHSPTPAVRDRLLAELAAAEAGLDDLATDQNRPTLPLGPADRRLLAVRAALWRAQGWPLLRCWQTNRWDPQYMGEEPPATAGPALSFGLLRGEVRGDVINLLSAADHELTLAVTAEGLPGGAHPAWLTVHSVAWTMAQGGEPVACALPTALDGQVTLPAGLKRQVWFSVDAGKLAPGDHRGALVLGTDGQPALRVPLSVHVSRLAMPEQLSLSLGGWDYTDGLERGVTAENVAEVVRFLQEYRVDAPWATGATMPFGEYDAAGNQTKPPSTQRMDDWLARWPSARFYCVFNAVDQPVPDTPAARQRVASWIRFWVGHLRARGVDPAKLMLLLLDEPHDRQQDATIVSWAGIVRQAAPEVGLFEDPTWDDPRGALPEMLSAATMLCPNRPMWLDHRAAFEAVYPAQQAADRQLALYSCSGPARSLDPYNYYLLQAWDCFRIGAVHEGFWAFGDNGGGSAWREWQTGGTGYTPQFLDDRGCQTSKHMEAIREGRFDYEYLTMLRAAIDKAPPGPATDRAKALLADAPRRVLAADSSAALTWSRRKDRAVADRVRAELLAALEELAG